MPSRGSQRGFEAIPIQNLNEQRNQNRNHVQERDPEPNRNRDRDENGNPDTNRDQDANRAQNMNRAQRAICDLIAMYRAFCGNVNALMQLSSNMDMVICFLFIMVTVMVIVVVSGLVDFPDADDDVVEMVNGNLSSSTVNDTDDGYIIF